MALNLHEIELIRAQAKAIIDWSAEIIPNATIDDLDELAIAKSRIMFKKVHDRIPAEEVDGWAFEYVKEVLPSNRTIDQQQRLLGNILIRLKTSGKILSKGRRWITGW